MSIQTEPKKQSSDSYSFRAVAQGPGDIETPSDRSNLTQKPTKKRKKKLSSRINMWIRRIHLFSGLFMLPWVLLYGFTALLFNHPTYMTDSKTEIENFSLSSEQAALLPRAELLAKQAIASANKRLQAESSSPVIVLADNPNAIFTRQVSGSVEDEQQSVSVILNMNNGKGYLRKRSKDPKPDAVEKEPGKEGQSEVSIENGLKLSIDSDPVESFKDGVSNLLDPLGLDPDKISLRGMPSVEFDASVDGKPVRMRLSHQRNRDRGGGGRPDQAEDAEANQKKNTYQSQLTIVGQNPREMSVRSYLLRLHMAHGYGVQTNSRWFWAIAVDLMFASMCFWGLSGVVMWWQIKRTRKLGFALLVASAIVATWLAIGMHWQLVNG